MTGSGYKTKQRDAILGFMIENKDRHVTVSQISEYLSKQGKHIGVTTIYRHLDKLLDNDLVRKYSLGPGECSCYQYAGGDKDCHEHFHLVCEKCGRLFHLECEHLSELKGHILEEHGFTVDPFKTVFYGLCSDCRNNEEIKEGETE